MLCTRQGRHLEIRHFALAGQGGKKPIAYGKRWGLLAARGGKSKAHHLSLSLLAASVDGAFSDGRSSCGDVLLAWGPLWRWCHFSGCSRWRDNVVLATGTPAFPPKVSSKGGPKAHPSVASRPLCWVEVRSCSATEGWWGGSCSLQRLVLCKGLWNFTPKSILYIIFPNNFQWLRLYELFLSFPLLPSASLLNEFGELHNADPLAGKSIGSFKLLLRAEVDIALLLSSLNLCLFWNTSVLPTNFQSFTGGQA